MKSNSILRLIIYNRHHHHHRTDLKMLDGREVRKVRKKVLNGNEVAVFDEIHRLDDVSFLPDHVTGYFQPQLASQVIVLVRLRGSIQGQT